MSPQHTPPVTAEEIRANYNNAPHDEGYRYVLRDHQAIYDDGQYAYRGTYIINSPAIGVPPGLEDAPTGAIFLVDLNATYNQADLGELPTVYIGTDRLKSSNRYLEALVASTITVTYTHNGVPTTTDVALFDTVHDAALFALLS